MSENAENAIILILAGVILLLAAIIHDTSLYRIYLTIGFLAFFLAFMRISEKAEERKVGDILNQISLLVPVSVAIIIAYYSIRLFSAGSNNLMALFGFLVSYCIVMLTISLRQHYILNDIKRMVEELKHKEIEYGRRKCD